MREKQLDTSMMDILDEVYLKINLFHVMCTVVLLPCMSAPYTWFLLSSEVGIRSFGMVVMDDYETSCGFWNLKLCPLEE